MKMDVRTFFFCEPAGDTRVGEHYAEEIDEREELFGWKSNV